MIIGKPNAQKSFLSSEVTSPKDVNTEGLNLRSGGYDAKGTFVVWAQCALLDARPLLRHPESAGMTHFALSLAGCFKPHKGTHGS